MRTFVIIAAAAATLAFVPMAAGAQTNSGASERMKGPPNSNGYNDKDQGAAPASDPTQHDSGSKMKGPPNANGMKSDASGK